MLHLKTFESFDEETELPIIFVSGLDWRPNDWTLDKQIKTFQSHLADREITSFCGSKIDNCGEHNNITKTQAISLLTKQPNSIVVLFSAGTGISQRCAKLIQNKKNLFILEPYPEALENVLGAIELGVPQQNVILGDTPGRGKVMKLHIPNHTPTPTKYKHFTSIEFVSELVSKLN